MNINEPRLSQSDAPGAIPLREGRGSVRRLHNSQKSAIDFRTSQDIPVEVAMADLPARGEEESWNQEFERQLFVVAADLIRPVFSETTWQAFQLAAIEGQSGQEVAAALGISVAAVYLAKSRVMVRLKIEIARLQVE